MTLKNVCKHCDLPISQQSIDSEFCCTGCEVAYHTIHSLGLDEYYKLKDIVGEIKPPYNSFFSKETFETEVVENQIKKISNSECRYVFQILGIHCAGCLWLLEKLPFVQVGILNTNLNFSSGELVVYFNPNQIKLSKIAELLNSLGYTPVLQRDLESSLTQKIVDKRTLIRIGIAAFSAMNTMILAVALFQGFYSGIEISYATYFRWLSFILSLPVIFYSATPFYLNAWYSIRMRKLHVDLPLIIAITAGWIISIYNTIAGNEFIYFDSVCALVFLLLTSRLIQARALEKARHYTSLSWNILPEVSEKKVGATFETIDTNSLKIGDIVRVKPGSRIPIDGVITIGEASIDVSILSGESVPLLFKTADAVYAGSLVVDQEILLVVTALASESRMAKIFREIKIVSEKKGKILTFTDRVSGYFIICVLVIAILTLLFWLYYEPSQAFNNTMAFLIVTCPCALALATPLSLGIAINKAAKVGLLIKGSETLEKLSKIKDIYIDKTGTLTTGKMKVVGLSIANNIEEQTLNNILFSLASETPYHPVSRAILEWVKQSNNDGDRFNPSFKELTFKTVRYFTGKGIEALTHAGDCWRLGSPRWIYNLVETSLELEQKLEKNIMGDSIIVLSNNTKIIREFFLRDELREKAKITVDKLKALRKNVFLLSGDSKSSVEWCSKNVGIKLENTFFEYSPEEKRDLISKNKNNTAMIGDGVNDAPALSVATVAIGISGGVETTLEVADVFLPDQNIGLLPLLFEGSDNLMFLIRKTLLISLFYNIIGGTLAVYGFMNPFFAALLMPLSSITVIIIVIKSKTF